MSNTIEAGKVVDLSYELTNSKGETLDKSSQQEPFTYLHGAQQIVEGLENALAGLKVGDKKKVVVPPEQGYGVINAELKMTVNRNQFPPGAELETGMRFRAGSPDGHDMVFTVAGVEGDQVTIDGNHELAGETLHFAVEVLTIRDATDEEKQHGHAHGPDGHGHDHDHDDHEHGEDCNHDHDHGHGHGHDHE